jgi:hypothetical protein
MGGKAGRRREKEGRREEGEGGGAVPHRFRTNMDHPSNHRSRHCTHSCPLGLFIPVA